MKTKIRNYIIFSIIIFLLFVILTLALMFIDIEPIGPDGSAVGLARINGSVSEFIGFDMLWYEITDWLGIAAFLTALIFAVIGMIQYIKRKSIRKVDFKILSLGLFYVIVILFYMFFEKCIINYRPVLINGCLEASYPSSHTMIVIFIMSTAIILAKRMVSNSMIRTIFELLSLMVIMVTLIGRIISGVHWITDIAGGLLLGSSLALTFYTVVVFTGYKHKKVP